MLSEVCRYLNNWFDLDRYYGEFTITGGNITGVELQAGQYFRVIGSVFNDGVYLSLAIPPEVIAISEEIDAWKAKYGATDSAALSPFQSESFGGYSYSKGSTSDGKNGGGDWTNVAGFTSRLDGWRKPRCRY